MLLAALQRHLSQLYEAPIEHRVMDFLVTDARTAQALEPDQNSRSNSERLLLRESDNAIDITLYIDDRVLTSLTNLNPYVQLDCRNLNDFLIALEGVSHFHYLIWHAMHARQVTQFELELQAEIDKFVTATLLLKQQGTIDDNEQFHDSFFTDITFADDGDVQSGQRYREANHYAAKYCRSLTRRFPAQHRQPTFINELRRFYRLSQNEKIRSIERVLS
ncbi:MAG: hypothetical protein EXR86_16350 [Gammaproteobacteria bacterium]|nr:hypothetical protein [Gammaproteobacteria bacterium]